MSLVFEEARKKISKDELKEALKLLEESLGELGLEEPATWRYRNDLAFLLSRCSRIQKEKPNLSLEQYQTQLNALTTDTLELTTIIEKEMSGLSTSSSLKAKGTKYRVEMTLDMDFEKTTDEELQAFLARIAAIIKTNPDEFTIMNKRPGSIIVELELPAEEIVKVKSLEKTQIMKGLNNITAFDGAWDWIWKSFRFYIYLPYSNLASAIQIGDQANVFNDVYSWISSEKAMRRPVNLIKADLSGANLSGVDLSGADLSGADLSGANLSGSDLSRADLGWVDLSNAKFSGANLSKLKLRAAKLLIVQWIEKRWGGERWKADQSGADLRNTNLSGAILHINQANTLNRIGVDISKVIFVDDDGITVENILR